MRKVITICLISILITGCASQGIKLEERDRSGKFDGAWHVSAHIEKQVRIVFPSSGGVRLTCPEENFSLTLHIKDGRMESLISIKGEGYIKEDGTFYVNEQFDKINNRHFIFSGHLSGDKGEGDVVVTWEHPTQGCKGTITLKKGSMEESVNQILNKDLPIMIGEDGRIDNFSISHTSKEYNVGMTFLSNAVLEDTETLISAFGRDNVDNAFNASACNSLRDSRAFIEGYAINVVIHDKSNKILLEFICDKL